MTGQRASTDMGLRLVPAQPDDARPTTDRRATVLHALGGPADVVQSASVVAALERAGVFRQLLVHTGEAREHAVPAELRADPGMPEPDQWLGAAEGRRAEQTAAMLAAFERLLAAEQPAVAVVYGQGDAALACALAASKTGIALGHVGSGLRSSQPTAASEINRVLVDRLADTLLAPSQRAASNLLAEGIPDTRVHAVGNTAVDVLRRHETRARRRSAWAAHGLTAREYVLVDVHAAANLDEPRLGAIVEALVELERRRRVVCFVHPAARGPLEAGGHLDALARAGVRRIDAPTYLDFLSLQAGAAAIVTDSGGVQDESSALGIPCYTLGSRTDRAVTLSHGTNTLLGDDPREIAAIPATPVAPTPSAIPLWDGHAGDRAATTLVAHYALQGEPSAAGRVS